MSKYKYKMKCKNIREKDYKDFIKNECVMCGSEIPGTWLHYNAHGNYCGHCKRRVGLIVAVRAGRGSSRQNKETYEEDLKELRKFGVTDEEIDFSEEYYQKFSFGENEVK